MERMVTEEVALNLLRQNSAFKNLNFEIQKQATFFRLAIVKTGSASLLEKFDNGLYAACDKLKGACEPKKSEGVFLCTFIGLTVFLLLVLPWGYGIYKLIKGVSI